MSRRVCEGERGRDGHQGDQQAALSDAAQERDGQNDERGEANRHGQAAQQDRVAR